LGQIVDIGIVFVSRDFEVGTVPPLRRVDRQSRTGLIYVIIVIIIINI